MKPERASREAYAREHGLSARTMFVNVESRRMNAAMHRWNVEFNKIIQFKIEYMQEKLESDIVSKLPISFPTYRGVYHIADDWHLGRVVMAVMPDGKVAVDTENCQTLDSPSELRR